MDGCVNLMKGAMLTANAVTTVSPTYAAQLHDPAYACGLEQVVHLIDYKLSGVLNGLDIESYDPAHDGSLPRTFDPDHMEGKAVCKAELQRQLGLAQEPDTPLMAIVSRLVGHKGMDLVCQGLEGLMAAGCQLVVLGQGESQFEDAFRWAQNRWPGRVSAQITYSDNLSRRIYGAADLFLMPSRSEPCGLSQKASSSARPAASTTPSAPARWASPTATAMCSPAAPPMTCARRWGRRWACTGGTGWALTPSAAGA